MVRNLQTSNDTVALESFTDSTTFSTLPLDHLGEKMITSASEDKSARHGAQSDALRDESSQIHSENDDLQTMRSGGRNFPINIREIETEDDRFRGDDDETTELPTTAKADAVFPWPAMLSLCAGMLAHSVVFTNPLPFVAFMVVDFKMADNVDSAGYYAGWITGTFMIGRTMSGLMWGMASDRYGRRMCLLLSMMNVAVFGLLLGFSTSFAMAVSLRLAIGLGNGFMGVAKTCISEICAKEHEVKAFGLLNGVWGLGLIVGPAVGGMMSRPAVQYPHVFSSTSIWGIFPYLMPCLVCAIIAVIAFCSIFVFLPETAGRNFNSTAQINIGNLKPSYPGVGFTALSSSNTKGSFCIEDDEDDVEEGRGKEEGGGGDIELGVIRNTSNSRSMKITVNVDSDARNEIDSVQNYSKIVDPEIDKQDGNDALLEEKNNHTEKRKKPSNFREILMNSHIRFLGTLLTGLNFSVMFVDESFPLWAVTSIQSGGLSWTSSQVGAALACVGVALVVFQFFLYEALMHRCCTTGPAGTFFSFIATSSAAIFILPIAAQIVSDPAYLSTVMTGAQSNSNHTSFWPVFSTIVISLIFYRVTATSAFSTLGIIANDSVDKELRGTLNGLLMTCGSVGNALGPILGSTLYAFLTDLPGPVDGRLVFIVGAAILLTLAITGKNYLSN